MRLLLVFLLLVGAAWAQDYEIIDRHALNASAAAEKDVDSLAAYLGKASRDSRGRARAVFRWIADRIDYDVASFQAKHYPDPDPAVTLSRRTAVCAGYARLYEALASRMGLEVQVIPGLARGTREESHAWNAVKLSGRWRLLDPTWGAGVVDDQGTYHKRFNDHYFLTAPDEFVADHFPDDRQWQLISSPITLQQFTRQPRRTSYFFRYGMVVSSIHQQGDTARLELTAPANVEMMGELVGVEGNCVLVNKRGRKFVVQARLPARSEYVLRVYAKPIAGMDDRRRLDAVYETKLVGQNGLAPFPKVYGAYVQREAELVGPLAGSLRARGRESFELRVPGARSVRVQLESGEWQDLARCGSDRFRGMVRLARGKVVVYANFDGSSRFNGLLEYQAR